MVAAKGQTIGVSTELDYPKKALVQPLTYQNTTHGKKPLKHLNQLNGVIQPNSFILEEVSQEPRIIIGLSNAHLWVYNKLILIKNLHDYKSFQFVELTENLQKNGEYRVLKDNTL